MKHFIVSRLALNYGDPRVKNWEDWAFKRVLFYNAFTRKSVANQSCQDFTLISLVDESVSLTDDLFTNAMLPNEIQLPVKTTTTYPWKEIVHSITRHVKSYSGEVIISRLDSDDVIHEDYVKQVQLHLTGNTKYVDIARSLTFNLSDGKIRESDKYRHVVSPFVSIREEITDFKCLGYAMPHHDIDSVLNGKKSYDIKAIQVIHDDNLVNTASGNETTIDFKQFGL